MNKIPVIALIGFSLILFYIIAFTDYRETVDKEFDKSGKEMTIVVYTYDNYDKVTDAFIDHAGEDLEKFDNPHHTREGWATWGVENNVCEIHVVAPTYAYKDNEMETWGHELAHCIYGRYHE